MLKIALWAALLAAPVAAGASTPGGANPWVPDTVHMSNPALPPISEVMAKAIRLVHERLGGVEGEQIVFNLPCGTPPDVYRRVIGHLGAARPMVKPWEAAIHVMEVRIRTVESEVDLINALRGVPQEMTISIPQGGRVANVHLGRYKVTPPGPLYSGC